MAKKEKDAGGSLSESTSLVGVDIVELLAKKPTKCPHSGQNELPNVAEKAGDAAYQRNREARQLVVCCLATPGGELEGYPKWMSRGRKQDLNSRLNNSLRYLELSIDDKGGHTWS
jgi:hypothetical protein